GEAPAEGDGDVRHHPVQGQPAVRGDEGQLLQQAPQLAGPLPRGDDRLLGAVSDEPDRLVVPDGLVDQGAGDLDRVLLRGLLVLPGVDGGVQVEDDPQVTRRLQVVLLGAQLAEAGRGEPVDAVQAVPRLVVPDAGGVRGHVQGAPAGAGGAGGGAGG